MRTPLSTKHIAWADLAEVRWHQGQMYDQLVFVRRDATEVKAAGLTASGLGYGERRALLALADIDQAWP